ncbi:GH3 family domain-containing protein [Neolewinella persica]|uniref:GH3 family domain-containing protein n=1 Tax=Neolewinella persica TaxID=70998 RepID=UPI000369BC48|nr:GH3 auxin-responsive promoter family protein [Neolewinella persica]
MLLDRVIELGLEAADKFPRRRRAPWAAQQRTLKKLLKKARKTVFGRAYDFAGILKSEEPILAFQQKVPAVDYNGMFTPWWERVYEGKEDITWPGGTEYYALSSGTSEANTKYIPVTEAMLKSLSRGAFRMFSCFPDYGLSADVYTASWLAIGGTTQLTKQGGRRFGYLSGINAREQPLWARGFYKPGQRIARIENFDDRVEEIARNAPNWNIGVIVGIPHWVQLTLERILEIHQLETISEIWPDLELFVSGGVDYRPYVKSFERLIGHPIKYMNTYLASEGMFAFQRNATAEGMQLLLDNGIFYEFLPFNEENFDDEGNIRPNARALTLNQVEEGREYALLTTSCNGAWRYLVGDTVRFLDAKEAVIQISGRTKHYINLATEHLTVDNMNAGVLAVEQAFNVRIPEFTIVPVKDDQYIAHEWYLGSKDVLDAAAILPVLDAALGEVNDDYKSERKTALQIKVNTVPLQRFYDWQRQSGQVNGQSKIPRVLKGAAKDRWLGMQA